MLARSMIAVLLAAASAHAQSALQRASIELQRSSIQRQRASLRPATATSLCAGIAPRDLGRMIALAANVNEVPQAIVREVARQESAFRPCAVSSKGAAGIMQLMPSSQASLGVRNPFDPQESLMAGARLLKDLLSRYKGDLALALSAYNAGPARVDRAAGVPAIAETQNYVARILSRLTD